MVHENLRFGYFQVYQSRCLYPKYRDSTHSNKGLDFAIRLVRLRTQIFQFRCSYYLVLGLVLFLPSAFRILEFLHTSHKGLWLPHLAINFLYWMHQLLPAITIKCHNPYSYHFVQTSKALKLVPRWGIIFYEYPILVHHE